MNDDPYKAHNDLLKEEKQIAWEQFQYSQKELHDTTLELNNLKEEAKANALKIEAYPRHLEEIQELRKENAELKEKYTRLNGMHGEISTDYTNTRRQLEKVYKEKNDYLEKYSNLNSKWNNLIAEVDKLKNARPIYSETEEVLNNVLSLLKQE